MIDTKSMKMVVKRCRTSRRSNVYGTGPPPLILLERRKTLPEELKDFVCSNKIFVGSTSNGYMTCDMFLIRTTLFMCSFDFRRQSFKRKPTGMHFVPKGFCGCHHITIAYHSCVAMVRCWACSHVDMDLLFKVQKTSQRSIQQHIFANKCSKISLCSNTNFH